jgi:hypothetical protein
VNNSTVLDFEVFPSFSLVVKVQDNGNGNLSSQANILVSLLDLTELPVNATWPLAMNASPSAPNGNFSAGNMVYGTGIGNISFIGAYASTWAYNGTSLAAAIANNDYLQFILSPTKGNNLNINTISLYRGVSGGSMSFSLFYSTDASFASYVIGGSVTDFNNTSLMQSSFGGMNISVTNGQTLYVRIYGWNGGISNYLRTKNVLISGTSWATPATGSAGGIANFGNNSSPIIANLSPANPPSDESSDIMNQQLVLKSGLSEGITSHYAVNKVRIFPNPVTDGILNVELEDGNDEQFDLVIFDLSGKSLEKRHYEHMNNVSLDLSAYPTGIYAINIHSFNFNFSDKVILK